MMLYIYIYIRKLNFLRSRFGEVFGEVLERFLERDLGKQKSQNSYVLHGVLMATIKNRLVFLGFWRFGHLKSIKIDVF